MWSSAASIALVASLMATPCWAQLSGPVRIGPVPSTVSPRRRLAEQAPVWERVRLSLLILDCGGQKRGVAALIDPKGFFIAHSSCATAPELLGRSANGRLVVLHLRELDEQTQLALFEASGRMEPRVPVLRVALGEPASGAPVIAATGSGPIRGEVVAGNRIGNMRPSLRYAPLVEFKFETSLDKVGGALVFDSDGELVGVLGATLASNQNVASRNQATDNAIPEIRVRGGVAFGGANTGAGRSGAQKGSPGGAGLRSNMALGLNQAQFGPIGLTVGYALGPQILQRVVDGFRSPGHKVEHPSIGVFFRGLDAGRKGALIEAVIPESPAARAGILVGDVVKEADGVAIDGPTDLAVTLFRQRVGTVLKLTVARGEQTCAFSVLVGTQDVTRKSLRNQRN